MCKIHPTLHNQSVPGDCSRVNRLLIAHGDNFVTEVVLVHFPEWGDTSIEQIPPEKFHLLEKKLENDAIEAGK